MCLLLLSCGYQEYNEMMEEPEQFVYLAQDCCESQHMRVIKTQSAILIKTLAKYLDGAVTQFVSFLCQSIDHKLGSNYRSK